MKRDTLMKPSRVASRLDCGITAAKHKMRTVLGGWYEPGCGWRCTERALNDYIARKAREGSVCAYPSSDAAQSQGSTGIATSSQQTDAGFSERSTSATTAPETPSEQPSPPIGKNKVELRLAKLIDQNRKPRLRERSTLSSENSRTQD